MSEGKDLLLSRLECNVIRGLAIIVIVLNNFGHHIDGVYPDNEFWYNYENVSVFLDSLTHLSRILPLELLSFYSPFGVMLFIFLSGYGLVLKYEKGKGKSVSHSFFIYSHYSKLFVMQAKGLAIFFVVFILYNTKEIIFFWPFVKQLLLVGNMFPNVKIIPGPYWFFGMIFEIYIIYRFIIYGRSSFFMGIIVLGSIVVMGFMNPEGNVIFYARINFFLALLPFSMGVFVARHWRKDWFNFNSKRNCFLCFLVAFILLTLCKFSFYTWLLLPFFVVVTTISLVKLLIGVFPISNVLQWLGGISGVMFVIHPTLREIMVDRANESGHSYAILFLYFFLTILLSLMLKPLFSNKNS